MSGSASDVKVSPAAEARPADGVAPPLPRLTPLLMIGFWMLLGAATGIKALQSLWSLLGVEYGVVSIAVPVGGGVGALAGALLGLISNPRMLVLLMAVFAGAAAGAVAGKQPWGEIGEVGGQVAGALLGGLAWAVWLYFGRPRQPPNRDAGEAAADSAP